LPRRKQVVTQDKSKVLRETEQSPFDADADDDDKPAPTRSRPTSYAKPESSDHGSKTGTSGSDLSSWKNYSSSSSKSKKDKEKDKKGAKSKKQPFNLEAEKDKIKTNIAESNIAATNLLNALRLINREREQISENKNAVTHFENCKTLRRKILRYVGLA
jgi:hypothetical protein